MKTKANLLLLVIALLCVIGWTTYGQRPGSNKQVWEYKSVGNKWTNFAQDATFNEMGAQGWDLATSVTDSFGGTVYVFKRAK